MDNAEELESKLIQMEKLREELDVALSDKIAEYVYRPREDDFCISTWDYNPLCNHVTVYNFTGTWIDIPLKYLLDNGEALAELIVEEEKQYHMEQEAREALDQLKKEEEYEKWLELKAKYEGGSSILL